MSFILDALRKSEHERQRQEGPAMVDLRVAPPRQAFPLWAVALSALLVVNLVVVLIVVLRGESKRPPPSSQTMTAPPAEMSGPVDLVAEPVQEPVQPVLPSPIAPSPPAPQSWRTESSVFDSDMRRSRDRQPAASLVDNSEPRLQSPSQPPPKPANPEPSPPPEDLNLPLAAEVRLPDGQVLPQMRLDIHVYARRPADRFVFINMRKYREGEHTAEGMKVERIATEGVILDYRGTRFLMPRQ